MMRVAGLNEPGFSRFRCKDAFAPNLTPAHKRGPDRDRTAAAIVRPLAVTVEQVRILQITIRVQIKQREVRIEAWSDATLVRQAKAFGHIRRQQRSHARER